jgi:predicted urease superfamily metal-dependent hydrolase
MRINKTPYKKGRIEVVEKYLRSGGKLCYVSGSKDGHTKAVPVKDIHHAWAMYDVFKKGKPYQTPVFYIPEDFEYKYSRNTKDEFYVVHIIEGAPNDIIGTLNNYDEAKELYTKLVKENPEHVFTITKARVKL